MKWILVGAATALVILGTQLAHAARIANRDLTAYYIVVMENDKFNEIRIEAATEVIGPCKERCTLFLQGDPAGLEVDTKSVIVIRDGRFHLAE